MKIIGPILLVAVAVSCGSARAATRNVACSGDITAALNTAIGASQNGDIVNIGAGSCTMSKLAQLTDKNITIQGAGQGATNITANNGFGQFQATGSNNITFRLTGISFAGTANIVLLSVWGDQSVSWKGPFRIDHIDVNYPNGGQDGTLAFWGPVYGLIDHNNFTQNYEAVILTGLSISGETCSYNYAWQGGGCSLSTLSGGHAAALAFEPGGFRNIYIEDNTFTGLSTNTLSAIDSAYSGARVVFRHNTLKNTMMYGHWTSNGSVNTSWWEVYGNTFTLTNAPNGQYPMRLQGGGTGLIYNNTFVGFPSNYILIGEGRLLAQGQSGPPLNYCDENQSVDGNAGDPAAPGWPCLAATGRGAGVSISDIIAGHKQPSFPLYLWGNGSFGVGIYSGAAYFRSTPHPNGDVDYSITATQPRGAGNHVLTYVPFPYPYPLTAAGLPNPGGVALPAPGPVTNPTVRLQ